MVSSPCTHLLTGLTWSATILICRQELSVKFIRDVFHCIAKDLETSRSNCHCQLYKYGYLMLQMNRKGIVPGMDPEKISCVRSLALRVVQVARELRALFDPESRTMSIPKGVKCIYHSRVSKPLCTYCARDFGSELRLLVSEFLRTTPGLCLSCVREGKEGICPLDACRHGLKTAGSSEGTSDNESEDGGSGEGGSDDLSTSTEE